MEENWNFQGVGGVSFKKLLREEGMDNFWNYTFHVLSV